MISRTMVTATTSCLFFLSAATILISGNVIERDGIAFLNDKFVLVGDAGAGKVYRLCIGTGAVAVALDHPIMKPPVGIPVGIDRIKIRDNTLYYSNAPLELFVKVPLHANGSVFGSSEILLSDVQVGFSRSGNSLRNLQRMQEIVSTV